MQASKLDLVFSRKLIQIRKCNRCEESREIQSNIAYPA